MRVSVSSFFLRYGLAVLIYGATFGLRSLLNFYSIKINFTIPVVAGLVATAWFAGRRPGLLLVVLYTGTAILSTPLSSDTALWQWVFSHFTVTAVLVFTVLVITERKSNEARLREWGERYRDIVENARDIIYTRDRRGNFTSVNAACERIIGYTREEALGMNLQSIVVPEDVEKAHEMFEKKLAGSDSSSYDLTVIAKNGRRVSLQINSRPLVVDGEIVGVQGIARDITDRKFLGDRLAQSQKLESVGRLAGGIAHDFNNMLTAINGFSDLILRRLGPDDPIRDDVVEIRKAGERSASLTSQLLAFSRKQVLHPELVDINTVIEDTANMLQRLIGEDVELLPILSPLVGKVKFDPTPLSQVLVNLCVNARDAMPDGGRLTIETSNVFLGPDYASSQIGVLPGAYVMLSVSDTGTGMDAEVKKHIFEPFFTTKEAGKGTGLGLAMAYGVVKQSGGNILVYSEVGHGTTVKIYLPRVIGKNEMIDIKETTEEIKCGDETILLVEDEDVVRNLAEQVLGTCGYTVVPASNGVEALSLCQNFNGNIDLLITDVVMPEMGGRELAKQFGEMYPHTPVLFTSGYTDDAIVRHGVIAEKTNFIQKPFDVDALTDKVRSVLDSG